MAKTRAAHLTFIACAATFAAAAFAQYKSIGPDGRVTYSDLPPPANARIVEQKKTTTGPAAPALPFELQQAVSKYPVTLYTGNQCPPCDEARAFLRTRGVPFTERTVTGDDDIALFKQQSPDGTAPVITVGGRRSVGWSQGAWSGLLDSAGYPTTSVLPRDYLNAAATPLSANTRVPGQPVGPTPPVRTTVPTVPTSPAPAPGNPPGFRF